MIACWMAWSNASIEQVTTAAVGSRVQQSSRSQRTLFHSSSFSSGWEASFLSQMRLKLFEERLYIDAELMAEHSLGTYSLCFDPLWVSVLITVHQIQRPVWWCLRDALSDLELMIKHKTNKTNFCSEIQRRAYAETLKIIFVDFFYSFHWNSGSVIFLSISLTLLWNNNPYTLVRFSFMVLREGATCAMCV